MGVEAIRTEGGIVFAQDRASAEFADMPAAAIATGNVDFILSPAAIAEELVKLKRHPYLRATPAPGPGDAGTPPIADDELNGTPE